ncbi:sulfotransferase domain-containing protein [Nocardioides sp. JQ2195]|uniref:sulfotransferase domain-containing protein n=1 Tax=Nocardioides sp. JQ2195 TaxID=2592334 RepID=UPI00143E3701|nr:sulfotransferase domain-containing protein [Nocardioides sp. JQ2195]QIX25479.1 sulfotransferase domain-containing protein [Nocardioides sp. JQ2195]
MSPSTPEAPARGQSAREWATRAVQWDPARNTIKRAVHVGARARGVRLERSGRVPAIANIYAAGSPKAGSQWMKALFDHPVVRRHTGLFTLPQLDYQLKPSKPFPAATFVPGLYFSHDEYLTMTHRHPHRLVYMFRDPRDLFVSGYFSAIGTHRPVAGYESWREELRAMPVEEGLLEIIRLGGSRLQEMATWEGVSDPDVATFRLEEVQRDPRATVAAIFKHCEIDLAPDELETVLTDVSREALQVKDLAQRAEGSESHYRVDRTTFRDLFTDEHHAAVDALAPGLAARLGYDD